MNTDVHTGRMPREDWGCAATSQGITRSQETGLDQTLPWSEGVWPCPHLNFRLVSPEQRDNKVLMF